MVVAPVVVVGEALVDIVLPAAGEPSSAVGGSPLNVAVGLSRLDVPSLLVTRVGDDEHGRRIVEHVHGSGALLSDASVVPGSRTSTATAHLDEANAASYEFDLVWDLAVQELPPARALHVGSLGVALPPGRRSVLDLVRQAEESGLFVSYDPNMRPAFLTDREQAWREVLEVAARSTLVKVSDEDLLLLRPDAPVAVSARALLDGPRTELVVVTRGGGGATAYTRGDEVDVAAPATAVVDTVGAGDSFMAALLAILADWAVLDRGRGALAAVDADRLAVLLAGSAAAAAITVSRRGANPPTRRELSSTWPE